MAKRELTEEELELLHHVPEITRTTNPYDKEMTNLSRAHERTAKQCEEKKAELQNLVEVECPEEPEPMMKGTAQITFGITAGVTVVLFLFHCLIWVLKLVFDISWDTWGWTKMALFWGIGISIVCTLLALWHDISASSNYDKEKLRYDTYKSDQKRLTKECKVLEDKLSDASKKIEYCAKRQWLVLRFAINTVLGIPCPEFAVGTSSDYEILKEDYLNLLDWQNEAESQDEPQRSQMKRELMDAKLWFFSARSLYPEVGAEVYTEFHLENQGDVWPAMDFRHGVLNDEGHALPEMENLPSFRALIEDDHLTPLVEEFEEVANRSTDKEGFFSFLTDSGKNAAKSEDMQRLTQAANEEFNEMKNISERVFYLLAYVRGCAYRNLYLASELVYYVTEKKKGGGLSVVHDEVDYDVLDLPGLEMDTTDLNADYAGEAIDALFGVAGHVLSSEGGLQFVTKNPKFAAGAAAIVWAGSLIGSYLGEKAANAEFQSQMIEAMGKISEGYAFGKANTLRAIEIIGAIAKSNMGFMAIYEPLRERVFEKEDFNLTQIEIMALVKAANEFKKTAKASIR